MVLILHFFFFLFFGRKNYLQYSRDDRRTFDVHMKKVTNVQFSSSLKVTEEKKYSSR